MLPNLEGEVTIVTQVNIFLSVGHRMCLLILDTTKTRVQNLKAQYCAMNIL